MVAQVDERCEMPDVCSIHSEAPAREKCAVCQKFFCDNCWVSARGVVLCRSCEARGKKRRSFAAVGALALTGVAAGAYITFFPKVNPAPVAEAAPKALSASLDYRFTAAPSGIGGLALSPDGKLLAS